jgi:hypothetical protein
VRLVAATVRLDTTGGNRCLIVLVGVPEIMSDVSDLSVCLFWKNMFSYKSLQKFLQVGPLI